MTAYFDFCNRNSEKSKNKRLAHILDCRGEDTSNLLRPLENFWTLNTHYPVKVKGSVKNIVSRTPALLYMAMLNTNPAEQSTILHLDRQRAQKFANESDNKRSPKEFGGEVFEWVMRLVTLQHYDEIAPCLHDIALSGIYNIAYLSETGSDFVGVEYKSTQEIYSGENIFGKALSNILLDYIDDPSKLLTVSPPTIEDFKLLGLGIKTMVRRAGVRDSAVAPRPSEVFKFGNSKSKSELFLEL